MSWKGGPLYFWDISRNKNEAPPGAKTSLMTAYRGTKSHCSICNSIAPLTGKRWNCVFFFCFVHFHFSCGAAADLLTLWKSGMCICLLFMFCNSFKSIKWYIHSDIPTYFSPQKSFRVDWTEQETVTQWASVVEGGLELGLLCSTLIS